MSNQEIAGLLKNIAAAYSIKDDKKFRFQIIAYQKAADTIAHLNTEIVEFYKNNTLDTIPGVGASIKSHLEELMKTGRVKRFEWVLKDIPEAVFPLLDIPSFGPKKAYALVKHFNLKDKATVIDDLEKLAKEGKIASLAGFGQKSQADILRAIQEFREGKGKTTRMVLPYAQEVADRLVEYLKKSEYVERVEPLGSLRRKVATVGDIDLAVASNNPKAVLDYFVSYPYLERVIEKGDVSGSILVAGGRQVDLLIQPPEAFGSLLQHFTGSKNHNVHLRELALKKGLSLSEYGIKFLKEKKQPVKKYKTEEEFYKTIGLDYIEPEMREDTGEIELAAAHKLPTLVQLKDLKGDLHIHSDYPIEPSHDLGLSPMQEMLDKAKDLGYEYLGFSEHNPSISKHTSKQIYEILKKRDVKIEQLKSSNKSVRIIKLLEVDILPSGELAIDDKSLNLLDGAIVSIHSVFSMDIEKMTQRVLKGLSHPKAKILAHPTGRLLNTRPGYELDWKKIFEFAKKHNKALEINSWPTRLDLPDSIIRNAVEAGVKMVIDTDSHRVNQMEMARYGVAIAKRGWAKKSDILNTLGYNDFSNWLKS
ncbi:MAG TPA: PHP domain-containing protein [Patescibacteria group bacterium]|nr:PHP domain-containing protein [Patescibacteria group bacterium]